MKKVRNIMKKSISVAASALICFNSASVMTQAEDNRIAVIENKTEEKLDNVQIFIVGDSTACQYGYDENYAIARNGWGMQLARFLKPQAQVINLAKSGRSSKSLTAEDNYTTLLETMNKGDFLLIQFGHNDAKKSSEEDLANRYTDSEGGKDDVGSFKNSLYTNYILKAQEKGVTPILLTPIVRRSFDENGKLEDTHGRYDDCVRELAQELNVELIDINEMTTEIYNTAGEENAKLLHAVYNSREKGADGLDNTHLNRVGAIVVASYVAKALESGEYSLSPYVDLSATAVNEAMAVTRGQFVRDLIRTIQVENVGNKNFADVNSACDYAQAVATALELDIARGDENADFNGERRLTYGEAFLFVQRALKAAGVDIAEPQGNVDYAVQAQSAYDALVNINAIAGDTFVENMNDYIDSTDAMYLCVKAYEEITEALELKAENAQSIDEIEKVE